MKTNLHLLAHLSVILVFCWAFPCHALFMSPDDVPVERLLAIAEAALAKDKSSADAHYTIARIHYLAFARGTRTVPAYMPGVRHQEEFAIPSEYLTGHWIGVQRWERAREIALAELGEPGPRVPREKEPALETASARHREKLAKENWRPTPEINDSQRVRHAEASLMAFRDAIRLKPDAQLYVLGLASLMEQIVDWKFRDKPAAELLSPEIARLDYSMAKMTYLKAFRAKAETDAKVESLGLEGRLELISHEAGVGILRLSDRDDAAQEARDLGLRREIQAHLEKVRKIPQHAITPIILSLRETRGISELLAREARVGFDLRGYGPAERWPWVLPTTGLLVWDPNGRSEITSGAQLFGGYTFQIFRADGYAALAALDDNSDGFLRGAELDGIRVWFDRDGDGRSTPEEVVDLAALGIVGMAVRATGADGIHPTNPAGVIFADGRTLPTWDWMVAPHRN